MVRTIVKLLFCFYTSRERFVELGGSVVRFAEMMTLTESTGPVLGSVTAHCNLKLFRVAVFGQLYRLSMPLGFEVSFRLGHLVLLELRLFKAQIFIELLTRFAFFACFKGAPLTN